MGPSGLSCQMLLANGTPSEAGERPDGGLFAPRRDPASSAVEGERGWGEGQGRGRASQRETQTVCSTVGTWEGNYCQVRGRWETVAGSK